MTSHKLKILPIHFAALLEKQKTFEVRYDDRNFQVGDNLELFEWCIEENRATGHCLAYTVTHMLRHHDFPQAIQPGYVVLSLKLFCTVLDGKYEQSPVTKAMVDEEFDERAECLALATSLEQLGEKAQLDTDCQLMTFGADALRACSNNWCGDCGHNAFFCECETGQNARS